MTRGPALPPASPEKYPYPVRKRGGAGKRHRTDPPERSLTSANDFFLSPGGQLLAEVRPGRPRLGHPGKSQFDQPVLERLLLAEARRRPEIDLRMSTEAGGLVVRPRHAEMTLTGPDGDTRVRAGWVIACDGGRSPVRAALGIGMTGSTQTEEWIVIDLLNTGDSERFAEFHCNGTRPAVVVPGVRGRCRFEFMLLPGETHEEVTTPEAVAGFTEPYLGYRVAPGDIRRARVYVAHQLVAERYAAGRVLLAGDAAHMMPPFAGQGLNAGIRDAANLAWKVAGAVSGAGTAELVATYEPERRPHAQDMVAISRRIGQVVMATDPRLTRGRDLLARAADLVPPAKAWLAGMKFLKQPHFTSGCVVPAARDVRRAVGDLVGRALPQPDVTLPGGERVPLDTLLGTDWCALRVGRGAAGIVEVIPLRPAGGTAPPEPVAITVPSGAITALAGTAVTVLVRPDRYVAAVTERGREADALGRLSPYAPWLPAAWHSRCRAAAPARPLPQPAP